jgi:hypothetical protein
MKLRQTSMQTVQRKDGLEHVVVPPVPKTAVSMLVNGSMKTVFRLVLSSNSSFMVVFL